MDIRDTGEQCPNMILCAGEYEPCVLPSAHNALSTAHADRHGHRGASLAPYEHSAAAQTAGYERAGSIMPLPLLSVVTCGHCGYVTPDLGAMHCPNGTVMAEDAVTPLELADMLAQWN